MEITLEKIELVKDRTGVSYKEAKEALEFADGSVVDAIINIEESIDEKEAVSINNYAESLVQKIKDLIRKGNVSRITVKKEGEIILNLPVNVGILGTAIAPVAAIAGIIVAFGTKCVIEVFKDDGTIVDVSEMATDAATTAKEKSATFIEEIKDKGSIILEEIKEKGTDVYETAREKSVDVYETVKEKTELMKEKIHEDEAEDCQCGCCEENCQNCDEQCECIPSDKELGDEALNRF